MLGYKNLPRPIVLKIKDEWLRAKLNNCDTRGIGRNLPSIATRLGYSDMTALSLGRMFKKRGNMTVSVIYRSGAKNEAKYDGYEEDRHNKISEVLEKLDEILGKYPNDAVWLRFGMENLDEGKQNLGSYFVVRGEIPKDSHKWS